MPPFPPFSHQDPTKEFSNLQTIFKQFSLESQHLESTYRQLEGRFNSIQSSIYESKIRMAGKLSELNFISHYLETILNHVSQGIIFIDLSGIITTCNPSALKILQLHENKILFHHYSNFFKDDLFGFSIQEQLSSKISFSNRTFTLNINHMTVILEIDATFVSMSPQQFPLNQANASPPIQGMLLLLRDVTHIHRLQELTHHRDRLKELGELSAHLAHKIRNPLGGIKGFANMLQEELKLQPDLLQMANYIVEGADNLSHLVNDVLSYSRVSQMHKEILDLSKIIKEIIELVQADSQWNQNIQLVLNTPVNPIFVFVDVPSLKSALLNLLINANQAIADTGTIKVDIDVNECFAIIRIQDSGSGISSENLTKIFSPFFTTKEGGTGLGLVEVKKVIDAHHGFIDVHSEHGKGTEFIIKIPFKDIQNGKN
ncbi:MAG: ATP-binding protein [Parachlamydiaceae bacterium]|nr:ATP-binding protein [Parachlamydiaceae bacterium]